jgi:VIT1/CCC1 family predicted Fe2+/Mn2+ transporter
VPQHQPEEHRTVRIGWLRALVLGANDGIVSTASLLVGVAAAQSSKSAVLLAGVAGVVAGAMSMAAGEYVSVSSQSDTERADLAREAHELEVHGEYELEELKTIYVDRGLEPGLASQVAEQLTAHDGLAAHGRDELGISHSVTAKPVQAAFSSAGAFAVGAVMPLLVVLAAPQSTLVPIVFATSVVFLAVLGVVSARLGGAPVLRATLRITFWGVLAMVLTAAVGSLFGVAA